MEKARILGLRRLRSNKTLPYEELPVWSKKPSNYSIMRTATTKVEEWRFYYEDHREVCITRTIYLRTKVIGGTKRRPFVCCVEGANSGFIYGDILEAMSFKDANEFMLARTPK